MSVEYSPLVFYSIHIITNVLSLIDPSLNNPACPNFLTSSAHSFTNFGRDLNKLLKSVNIPVHAETYHPEDVEEERRSPVGVIVLEVEGVQTNM